MLPLLDDLLIKVLPSLYPLLKKRDTYYVAAIAVLAFLLWRADVVGRNEAAALAARANVRTHAEVVTKTVRVAGPVHYDVKTVYVPGTKEIQYVERVITRDPVTTTTVADRTLDRVVAPACAPAAPVPWRSAGVLLDPLATTKIVGLRGGVTLFRNFELGAAARFVPNPQIEGELGVRF